MTLLNEAAETDQGLIDYLAADSTLTALIGSDQIYSQFTGIKSVRVPIVRFFLVETDDLLSIGATGRVWSELVYQVEAVTGGYDSTDAADISQRVDQLLHGLRGETWGDVLIEEVFRRQPLFRRELEGDQPYIFAGGEYVFRVSAP